MSAKIFTLEGLRMTPTIELHAQPIELHAARDLPRLDRGKWHSPLISIVVTHFNYSDHIRDALLSLVDQSYQNWECVIVDDCSTSHHRIKVSEIVHEIGSNKIRMITLSENQGQIGAFFAGLDETSGEFVSLLDPDDRYAQTFLEEAIGAHLNQTVMCPIVSTDQWLVKSGEIISQVNSHHRLGHAKWTGGGRALIDESAAGGLFYTPADRGGWHWTSTSSLMMRRAALQFLKPHKQLYTRNSVDSYVAQGLHRIGGTLFLAKPLVYRTLHDRNEYISDTLFSSSQNQARPTAVCAASKLLLDAIEALEHNGAPKFIARAPAPKEQGRLAKWKRSFIKRRDWLLSELAQGPQR